MSSMKHKLVESRHDLSRMDQQQQLAEKRWEEDKMRMTREKANVVAEMRTMNREKRQADLYIKELQDRLAVFERGENGRNHRHHKHHRTNALKGHKSRPQTAGPATRSRQKEYT